MSCRSSLFTRSIAHKNHLVDDYALCRIEYRVKRLADAFGLGEHEEDDLRQEMTAELLKASRRYDPARSHRNTFVTRTLDRHYLHVARRLANHRRHEAMKPTPISALKNFCPAVNDPGRGELSERDRTDLRIDLAGILAALPLKLRRVCTALKSHTPGQAAAQLGVHRSTVYRAIREIRGRFIAAGLGGVA